jgi:hypothetical protein
MNLNSNVYYVAVKVFKQLRAIITKTIFTFLIPQSNSLFVTYFAESKELQDGIGAQLQRILGIIGVSNNLKINYVHTPIKDFTATPLDLAQKHHDRISYCKKIDKLFEKYTKLESISNLDFYEIIVDRLNLKILLKYIFLSKLNHKNYLLRVKLPFPLIDSFANWYQNLSIEIMVRNFGNEQKITNKKVIAVHFRNGIKSNHKEVLGLNNRWLSDNYFSGVINNIINSHKLEIGKNTELKIFTDSPANLLKYYPPKEQIYRYFNSGYEIIGNHLYVYPFDFKNSMFKHYPKIEIIYGGDAFKAIMEMARADFLIMSRSSMSYCAAILNDCGKIYYPPNFWHAPMPNWIRVKV